MLKSGTAQSTPANRSKLSMKSAVWRSGRPNSTFRLRQAWIAATLRCCWRPRLPLGGDTHTISGSNQIESGPGYLKLSLQDDQFVVLYFVGAQPLVLSSHHAEFTK